MSDTEQRRIDDYFNGLQVKNWKTNCFCGTCGPEVELGDGQKRSCKQGHDREGKWPKRNNYDDVAAWCHALAVEAEEEDPEARAERAEELRDAIVSADSHEELNRTIADAAAAYSPGTLVAGAAEAVSQIRVEQREDHEQQVQP